VTLERKGKTPFNELMDRLIVEYMGYKPGDPDPAQKAAVKACYSRYGRAVRDILAFALQDPEKAMRGIYAIGERMEKYGLNWNLDTAAKRFPEWHANPEAFERETNRR